MHADSILGGRYVEHTWKGNMMGMPFEGRGTDAYDNVGKMYVSSWVDNMGTGIMQTTGTCDADAKVCKYSGDMFDPMMGKKTARSVITWMDDNTFKNEMYAPGPDGKEAKMMEIVAKRKSSAQPCRFQSREPGVRDGETFEGGIKSSPSIRRRSSRTSRSMSGSFCFRRSTP